MKAYSQDVRERVLRAVDQGYQRVDIIKLFGVSRATIKRYLKHRRETGAVNVKPIPGRPPKKFAPLQAHLVAQLEAHPDAKLEAHCQMWEEQQGVAVSTSTMSRAIRRVGWTRKKRRWVPTSRNEETRAAWREHLKHLDARKLVVIDECGSNIALTPLSARAPKGARAGRAVFHAIGEKIRPCLLLLAGLAWASP
jgi:transposase